MLRGLFRRYRSSRVPGPASESARESSQQSASRRQRTMLRMGRGWIWLARMTESNEEAAWSRARCRERSSAAKGPATPEELPASREGKDQSGVSNKAEPTGTNGGKVQGHDWR